MYKPYTTSVLWPVTPIRSVISQSYLHQWSDESGTSKHRRKHVQCCGTQGKIQTTTPAHNNKLGVWLIETTTHIFLYDCVLVTDSTTLFQFTLELATLSLLTTCFGRLAVIHKFKYGNAVVNQEVEGWGNVSVLCCDSHHLLQVVRSRGREAPTSGILNTTAASLRVSAGPADASHHRFASRSSVAMEDLRPGDSTNSWDQQDQMIPGMRTYTCHYCG